MESERGKRTVVDYAIEVEIQVIYDLDDICYVYIKLKHEEDSPNSGILFSSMSCEVRGYRSL